MSLAGSMMIKDCNISVLVWPHCGIAKK